MTNNLNYTSDFDCVFHVFLFPGSVVGMRSGVTGVLTWPWFFPTSHMHLTWTHAPSRPWETRWVNTHHSHPECLFITFIYLAKMVCVCLCFTASKGLLDAAHFCYLMAQVGFGVFTKKSTKMVLIGSNHRYTHRAVVVNLYSSGY